MTPGSIVASAPTARRHAVRQHLDGGAWRRIDASIATSARTTPDAKRPLVSGGRPRANRLDEIRALVLQRLTRLDLRADDVAVAHQQLEFAVRFGHRLTHGYSSLVDAHAFGIVEIVEHDAAVAAHGHDFADLVRVRPADVNVADHLVGVTERRKADVLAARPEHGRRDGRCPQRLFVQQVVENRHVVRRQVPERVHVLADRAQVGSRGVQVVRLAELLRRHAPFIFRMPAL